MTRNIVHAAFSLLASLLGVAGLFLLAFAGLPALLQLLVCGSAVVVVIRLSLMPRLQEEFERHAGSPRWPAAVVAAVAIFGLLAASVLLTAVRTTDRQGVELGDLGKILFGDSAIPLGAASLLLLVALIGAAVIARGSVGRE